MVYVNIISLCSEARQLFIMSGHGHIEKQLIGKLNSARLSYKLIIMLLLTAIYSLAWLPR